MSGNLFQYPFYFFSTLFWLPILVIIAFVNILLTEPFKNPFNMSITFAMFVAILPILAITKLIGFQAIFQFPLPLISVWKDFVHDELEEKDVR